MALRLLASPTLQLAALGLACLASRTWFAGRPARPAPDDVLDRVYG